MRAACLEEGDGEHERDFALQLDQLPEEEVVTITLCESEGPNNVRGNDRLKNERGKKVVTINHFVEGRSK